MRVQIGGRTIVGFIVQSKLSLGCSSLELRIHDEVIGKLRSRSFWVLYNLVAVVDGQSTDIIVACLHILSVKQTKVVNDV